MFITIQDLPSVLYGYQITQITQGDDTIVERALMTAIEEMRSYFAPNHKKEWKDGRLNYDVNAIFNATGTERNPLLVAYCVTIAKWYIVELSNVDIIYEQAKERYDRAIGWLKQLAKGELNLDTLPKIEDNPETDTEGTAPFNYGSRLKFKHE
jgi:hypothetical protein